MSFDVDGALVDTSYVSAVGVYQDPAALLASLEQSVLARP
jgi:hypothetical protein